MERKLKGIHLLSRPWKPQDLLDDLQLLIDEEPDRYLNDKRTTMCMARDFLKAYFDTGLEPEKVAQCRKYKDNHFAYMAREGMYIARPDIELMIGVGADKWKEIALADKEGRLVVLPYKAGQVVWVIRSQTSNGKNLYLREERIARYVISECDVAMCFESGRVSVSKWHWETSVFLTREEAEAAMKRR